MAYPFEPLLVDFETAWSDEYTLKKLSTSEYVRDNRFKVHGAAIRTLSMAKSRWFTARELPDLFDAWAGNGFMLVAHHAQFDGFILREHYGIVPNYTFCTRDAARNIYQGYLDRYDLDRLSKQTGGDGKLKMNTKGLWELTQAQEDDLAVYACNDGDEGWRLFLEYWPAISAFERDVMCQTHMMFINPRLQVDIDLAREAQNEEAAEAAQIIAAAGFPVEDLRSDAKLADILSSLGVDVPYKTTAKGNVKPAFAKSDVEFQELQNDGNPLVRAVCEARLVAKANSTGKRAERLIQAGTTGDGTLPVYLNYWGAGPGRKSGGNKMNLQNLKRGSKLRKSIRAPDGYVLGVADSGQIQCRVNAYVAGERWVIEAFAAKRDIYSEMATDIFGFVVTKKNIAQRFIGKQAVLGLGFQAGPRGYLNALRIGAASQGIEITLPDEAELKRIVYEVYRPKHPFVVQGWNTAEEILRVLCYGESEIDFFNGMLRAVPKQKGLVLPSGRMLLFPHLHEDENGFTYMKGKRPIKIYAGKTCENWVMGIERDVMAEQSLRVQARYPVVMDTHDEIVALIPEAEAEEGHKWVLEQLTIPPSWLPGIPLSSEGGFDYCYSK